MTLGVLAQAAGEVGTGEAVAFWVLGPVALAGALGLVFARHAVHAALLLVLTMFAIAVLYVVQAAPFLGFVQIIVYTGAVMMLFLFVLMLVGKDSRDSVIEVLRGQRAAALLFGLGLAALLVVGISRGLTQVTPAGLQSGGQGSSANVTGLGRLIFTDYLLAFELSAALLMVAALGGMVLTAAQAPLHTKIGQRATVLRRLRGEHARVSPLPGPGVYATANSVAVPALLPDGSIAPESLADIIESVSVDVPDTTTPDAHALTGRPAGDRTIEAGEAADTGAHTAVDTEERR